MMPPVRMLGGAALSWLTRLASGYWHLGDSQCGYTVASRRALASDRPAPVRALRLPERSADAARGRARAHRRRAGAAGVRAALALGAAPAARGAADRAPPAARRSARRVRARWRGAPVVVEEAAPRAWRRHEHRRPHHVVSAPRRRLRGQLRRRSRAAAARRRPRGRRAGGGRRGRPARNVDESEEIEHARLTVTRIAPGPAGERENESVLRRAARPRRWSGAARASGSRRRVSRCALAAAVARARIASIVIESHWLVPSALAALAAAPAGRHRAFAHSGDVALLERIPFGRAIARRLVRGGIALRFVSAALQARFAALAGGPVRSAPSSRWSRTRANGRARAGVDVAGPAAARARGPDRARGWPAGADQGPRSAAARVRAACRPSAPLSPPVRSRW